jgi:hypothetical protein
MIGVGPVLAMLMLAGTPDVSGTGRAEAAAQPAKATRRSGARPLAPVIDLGSKWGTVTSVWRSPAHNRAVGGAENSFHLSGRAIDIARRPGVRHADIAAAYRKAGHILIESLDEGDHSHFAFGLIGSFGESPPPKATELATVAAPKCTLQGDALTARRRPDRANECPDAPDPQPRLRPITPAN